MGFYLGVDAGGTKTECWLGNETEVLGRGACGSVKVIRVEEHVAKERLRGMLREVEDSAGVRLQDVTRTCVGLAGVSIVSVRKLVRSVFDEMVGGDLEICGDEEIALEAAFKGGAGVLVIGGTGSAVVGRCGDGTRFTAGGWGPAIGDEGSGYWIGSEAIRAAFRALDEGVQTGLVDGIKAAWGAEDIDEVVGVANARPGPDFAALAPVVMRVAETGDKVAKGLLERAGWALAEQVGTVAAKMRGRGEGEVRVAYTGSVLARIEPVRVAMTERLMEMGGISVLDGAVNALEGALWRARRG